MSKPIPLIDGLRFEYRGGGMWSAASRLHDEGSPFYWHINVLEDGTFSVGNSDSGLTGKVPSFASLDAAKEWCDRKEFCE